VRLARRRRGDVDAVPAVTDELARVAIRLTTIGRATEKERKQGDADPHDGRRSSPRRATS
jgi:hypothetical protein